MLKTGIPNSELLDDEKPEDLWRLRQTVSLESCRSSPAKGRERKNSGVRQIVSRLSGSASTLFTHSDAINNRAYSTSGFFLSLFFGHICCLLFVSSFLSEPSSSRANCFDIDAHFPNATRRHGGMSIDTKLSHPFGLSFEVISKASSSFPLEHP